MNLNKYEKKYKCFIQVNDRLNELWKEIKNLPLNKLPEPIQRGWIISYQLVNLPLKEAEAISKAFSYVCTDYITRDVNRVRAVRQGETFLRKNKSLIDLRPHLYRLLPSHYEKLPENIKKYFTLMKENSYGREFEFYKFNQRRYLKLKAKPNILTHQRQKGGELEKEYEYLNKLRDSLGRQFWPSHRKKHSANKERAEIRAKISKFKAGEIEEI